MLIFDIQIFQIIGVNARVSLVALSLEIDFFVVDVLPLFQSREKD